MPANTDVQYLRPGSQDNPFLLTETTNHGEELTVDGPWCIRMMAPTYGDMTQVIKAFFEGFMGIYKPVKNNTFYWNGQPRAKFITRKNCNPNNNKTWNTNYTITVELVGGVDVEACSLLLTIFGAYPFLIWSGAYSFDCSRGEIGQALPCECTNKEEVDAKIKDFHKARLERYNVEAVAEETSPSQTSPSPALEPADHLQMQSKSAPLSPASGYPDWQKLSQTLPGVTKSLTMNGNAQPVEEDSKMISLGVKATDKTMDDAKEKSTPNFEEATPEPQFKRLRKMEQLLDGQTNQTQALCSAPTVDKSDLGLKQVQAEEETMVIDRDKSADQNHGSNSTIHQGGSSAMSAEVLQQREAPAMLQIVASKSMKNAESVKGVAETQLDEDPIEEPQSQNSDAVMAILARLQAAEEQNKKLILHLQNGLPKTSANGVALQIMNGVHQPAV